MLSQIALESPQSLYLHLPFCIQKCAYCDFTIKVLHRRSSIASYLEALIQELQSFKAFNFQLKTIYFGGGTPSLLNAEELKQICACIHEVFDLSQLREWTFEVNPENVNEEVFKDLFEWGINRLSLGVQSFNEEELKLCKRTHNSDSILWAWECLRGVGFNNVSVDLIYGLPQQKLDSWQATLNQVIQLKPEHLSLYSLQVEPKTEFAYLESKARLTLPPEEDIVRFYNLAVDMLQQSNYLHYEIANWAFSEYESQHNSAYWQNVPYLAVGVGAHGYWQGRRYENPSSFKDYFAMCNRQEWSWKTAPIQTLREEMEETVFLGLRLLNKGLDCQRFKARFGRDVFTVFERELSELIEQNLLHYEGSSLYLPEEFVLISNEIFERFVEIDAH